MTVEWASSLSLPDDNIRGSFVEWQVRHETWARGTGGGVSPLVFARTRVCVLFFYVRVFCVFLFFPVCTRCIFLFLSPRVFLFCVVLLLLGEKKYRLTASV